MGAVVCCCLVQAALCLLRCTDSSRPLPLPVVPVGPAGPVLQHLPVLESVPVLVALQDIVPLQALLVPVETARKHLSQASHTLLQMPPGCVGCSSARLVHVVADVRVCGCHTAQHRSVAALRAASCVAAACLWCFSTV